MRTRIGRETYRFNNSVLLHKLLKLEQEQGVELNAVREVLGELATELAHDAKLLRLNERLKHDTDGHIDVLLVHNWPEVLQHQPNGGRHAWTHTNQERMVK